MMPANTKGRIQELMKLPKITKKEDGILLQYQYFFTFICYSACILRANPQQYCQIRVLFKRGLFKKCVGESELKAEKQEDIKIEEGDSSTKKKIVRKAIFKW